MTVYHDEVEIEDFEYDEDEDLYTYPCVSGCNYNGYNQRGWKLIFDDSLTVML